MKQSTIWFNEKRRAAYHEAAHAFIALQHEIPFEQIEVYDEANDAMMGCITIKTPFTAQVHQYVECTLAGLVQDRRSGLPDYKLWLSAKRDMDQIEECNPWSKSCNRDRKNKRAAKKEFPTPEAWNKLVSDCEARVYMTLGQHAEDVRLIAEVLFRTGKLTHAEVKELVSS